ncbi:hypothetical protein ER308_02005 [Egibacter rhizosphaerae]|uniref:Uncharacterized protein n=1 Tax=Egibacter rhizosphaerae TaxID=1670831 RepID=A0A411YB76_9ACTN|nr:hypothetical protein [Egibacter rhizosphaerae]QBI18460.1 hypothetical protein ER308_02005 [Egibacter rhizosphaerae]
MHLPAAARHVLAWLRASLPATRRRLAAQDVMLLAAGLSFWAAWLGGWVVLAVTYRAFTPVPVALGPLLVASGATGSFLAGMSLGWVLLLEIGVEVGRAYGGSEELGAAVLFLLYLFLVQLTCLVGYSWALDLHRPVRGAQ